MTEPVRFPRRPPRITLFSNVRPFYFVTFVTAARRSLLANADVHAAMIRYGELGHEQHAVAVGPYVIMPDHVHVFVVLPETGVRLTLWVRGLKRALGEALSARGESAPFWQEGFFDHVIRNAESYSEKWHYVNANPVRRSLVSEPEARPWRGEIVPIQY
jgi:putative transposase